MNLHKPYDQASRVTAVRGDVVLDGPNGLGLSLTPKAAMKTGERLLKAAMKAKTQSPPKDDKN